MPDSPHRRAPLRRAVLLAAAAVLVACGGSGTVPLADLVIDAERHDGEEIRVQGVVQETRGGADGSDTIVVLRDGEDNRIQLVPTATAAPHAGSAVEVSGRFEFDPARGRLLHVEALHSLHPSAAGEPVTQR